VISDLSDLKVEIYVPERYVGRLKQGLPAIVGFEAFPGQEFEAAVSRLSPVLDQASRTLRVELDFAGLHQGVKAGMFAGVRLVTEQRKDVPLVPKEAILSSVGEYAVYVVNELNGKPFAEKRTVQPGLQGKENVEILSGLEPGEFVVVKGQNFLSDGDQVRIIPREES
jgi:RND family efflux transporter MFP subunit